MAASFGSTISKSLGHQQIRRTPQDAPISPPYRTPQAWIAPATPVQYPLVYPTQSFGQPIILPCLPATAVSTIHGTSYYHPVSFLVPYQSYPTTSTISTTYAGRMPTFQEYTRPPVDYVDMSQMSYVPAPEHPEIKQTKLLDIHMTVEELYNNIQRHLSLYQECRVSWLNRMLAKCESMEDFEKAIEIFKLYQFHVLETTPETGTLLIKAACRAGKPEEALGMLKDVLRIQIWPTLGGIHYLMINFSLKKDTRSVMDTYGVTKLRNLKPNSRTFHILIRECVDNSLIEDAMVFHEECKAFDIVPNRVTYNILMNGCRKFNKPGEILALRGEMDHNGIEINDTTVKFTVLAHMMMDDLSNAINAFYQYPDIENALEEFCTKFFEVGEEDTDQKKCVIRLFQGLREHGQPLPETINEKLGELQQSLEEGRVASVTKQTTFKSSSSPEDYYEEE